MKKKLISLGIELREIVLKTALLLGIILSTMFVLFAANAGTYNYFMWSMLILVGLSVIFIKYYQRVSVITRYKKVEE